MMGNNALQNIIAFCVMQTFFDKKCTNSYMLLITFLQNDSISYQFQKLVNGLGFFLLIHSFHCIQQFYLPPNPGAECATDLAYHGLKSFCSKLLYVFLIWSKKSLKNWGACLLILLGRHRT